jgi:hypothetical protein
VVLDEKKAATDAAAFGENFTDVGCMVEHVHEHADIERRIRKRDM